MRIRAGLIGDRIVQLRELRGASLTSVAAEAGIAKSYLAKLERGQVENPGIATLDRVAEVLGTTLVDLFAPATGSHKRPRWSAVVDPLEMERLRAAAPPELVAFLSELERTEGGRLSADVVRTLAMIQIRGKRPSRVEDWRFVYQAIMRSL